MKERKSAHDFVPEKGKGLEKFREAARDAKNARSVLGDGGDDPETETERKAEKGVEQTAQKTKRAVKKIIDKKKAANRNAAHREASGAKKSPREVLQKDTVQKKQQAARQKTAPSQLKAGNKKTADTIRSPERTRSMDKNGSVSKATKAAKKRASKAAQKKAAKTAQKNIAKQNAAAAGKQAAKSAGKGAAKTALSIAGSGGGIVAMVVLIVVVIVILLIMLIVMISAATEMNKSMSYDGMFYFPLQNHDVHNCEFTDSFGASRDGGKRGHMAIDIGSAEGDPIYAMVSGKVVTNRWNGQANAGGTGGGWEITIEDEKGWRYKSLHMMQQSTLPVGTEVYAGQTILGYVGHTGANITANHLHLSIMDENGAYINPYEMLRRSHDAPWDDPAGNLPADGNKPAVLNSVVSKPPGVSAPIMTLTGYRITYYSGGEGETVDRYGNKLVIGTAAKWMGLNNSPYPNGMPDGTIFSIGDGAEERFFKITDVGSFGKVPNDVKRKTLDLFAGDHVPASELTSSKYGTQTGVTIKIWKWG